MATSKKVRVFQILNSEDKNRRELIAEFLTPDLEMNWKHAKTSAYALSQASIFDYAAANGKTEEVFNSPNGNTCPGCGYIWRYSQLEGRINIGTNRCDCGVLFALNWSMNPQLEQTILDVDTESWKKYIDRYFLEEKHDCDETRKDEARFERIARWIVSR